MNNIVAFDNIAGKIRRASDIISAENIIELKKKSGGDPWPVIDRLIEMWRERTPSEFKAFKLHLQWSREDLKDRKFGQTSDKNMDRRLIVIIPQSVHLMIRSIYSPQELAFSKEFFKHFAKRYNMFQIPDKL